MINNRLLIVDDDQSIINCVSRQLRSEKYDIFSATSGEAGLNLIEDNNIGVVLSDLMMPDMNGIEFLNRVKKTRSNVVRILFTAYATMENAITAINNVQVFRYLSKPWSQDEMNGALKQAFEYYNLLAVNERMQKEIAIKNAQLQSINENLERLISKRTTLLEDSIREGVGMLAMAAEAKDNDTGDHLLRISSLTKEICLEYGLSSEQSEKISFFSIMHDIGKIHVPDIILQKKGPLDPDEWEIMKAHSISGEKILGVKPFYKIAREIARSHHEKWDGSGYPDGLMKHNIPVSARIVSIADVFDALTTKRKYKEAWPWEKAFEEIIGLSGKSFEPEIINAFSRVITKRMEEGSKLELSVLSSGRYNYIKN